MNIFRLNNLVLDNISINNYKSHSDLISPDKYRLNTLEYYLDLFYRNSYKLFFKGSNWYFS